MTTPKQLDLIKLYEQMALQGVDRSGGGKSTVRNPVPSDYSLMNIALFKDSVRPLFQELNIRTVLDYGSGQTSWDRPGFDGERSAKEFFDLQEVVHYEPATGLCDLVPCDAVVSFDVLEHIFLADVSSAVWDLFAHANYLVVVNVACYPARAILPNGENAHVTIRPPAWWKGVFDAIAIAFPHVIYRLYASTAYGKAQVFADTSMEHVISMDGFERPVI